jgi:DNA-directed RNA polymerase subunit M/transcription elongation factor TFIIS
MSIDLHYAKMFGYQVNTIDELFNCPIFESYKEVEKERNEKFLKPSVEGSEGPCRFCKSTETYLIEKQRRSGDEAKDFDIHCSKCGKSWKAS